MLDGQIYVYLLDGAIIASKNPLSLGITPLKGYIELVSSLLEGLYGSLEAF